ncbi:MAG TPA: hypothetical protein VMF10_13265 [Candidatus Aquilonibacter sp.]|nr:hypothetical protein [Candidatus Aquilonibacter sp.]
MPIKFQYNGYLVECDTPDEAKALMNGSAKTPSAGAKPITRGKPIQASVGQERYQAFINSLSDNLKKVVIAIGSHAQISMDEARKIVGAENNMGLSAWITTAGREAKKRDIQPEQLWEKTGPRGSVKFIPTPALRTAVEGLRDNKISAVKQTA